jgi:hypothetical protein
MKKILQYKKNYPKIFAVFILGSLLLALYFVLYITSKYDIAPWLRMLGYTGFLLVFSSMFVFFTQVKRYIFSNIMLTLNLVLLLEIVCFFLLGMPGAVKKDFSLTVVPPDHIAMNVGSVPYADSTYHSVLMNDHDTVYDVKYTIDHYSKRTTPDHDSLKNKHALFFGCSIAFGEGLEDNQTLGYNFQKESGEYNSYSYSYPGYGTNHMLARLQYQSLTNQVVEKDGVAFYVFFWGHVYRSIGPMEGYCGWLSGAPYYKMEGENLVRDKMFKNGRYFISKIYEYIYQTNIVKYFKMDFPLKINSKHVNLVCEMVKQSKIEYQKQFGKNDFYVVIYPTYINYTDEELTEFKNALTKMEIDYIDLTTCIKYGPEHTLNPDPHPNANTSELVAKELKRRYYLEKSN